MAGAGFKTFNTGDVLTASDVNTYLMQQTVMVFDDASARSTALPTPSEGMFSYLKDTNLTYRYDGSAWLSDAGTTSPLTTKGDVWGYSTTDARIPVGANGTVLTADSAEALGVKWAAPASGGMTSLATGTLSGSSVALNSISGSYNNLELHISGWNTGGGRLYLRINGDTGSNYTGGYVRQRDGVGLVAQYANSPGQTAEIRSDGDVTSDSGATNTVIFRLPNYTATAGAKVVEAIAYTLSTYKIPAYSFWGYTGTAGAITSLTIVGTSNFTAGTYTLWGVK